VIADRWGVTDEEVARAYPCDGSVRRPAAEQWREVTVQASAADVWPWVVQIRVAPYSYDWIDNLGRRSPRRLLGLADPVVGDPFTATAGRPVGRVTDVDPGVHLTGMVLGAGMSYVLSPDGPDRTRLLLKVVAGGPRVLGPAVAVGDLVMARRQLVTLRELAESHRRQ